TLASFVETPAMRAHGKSSLNLWLFTVSLAHSCFCELIESPQGVINFCYSCHESLAKRPMRNKLDSPSLRQLRAFEAVARGKSIGAAAAELGLSQPAVTQMVVQIETALAVNLLERRRTGTYLTTLGS